MKFSRVLLAAACPFQASSMLFDTNRLQPEVVALSLVKMEDEWRAQAEVSARCNTTAAADGASAARCKEAVGAFEKSCSTVVSAVQRASSGDRAVVTEYMGEVCARRELDGWRKLRCQSLAASITGAMTADNYDNRMRLNVVGLCQKYWTNFATAETERVKKEQAEEDARRAAQEAADKKLAEERAAAAKKAAEEAAALAKKRAAEDAARKEAEAKKKAEEEKQHAEEEMNRVEKQAREKAEQEKKKAETETAELKAKEEKALKEAEEAKKKMEQAKAAAEEARQKREATAKKSAPAKPIAKPINSTASFAIHKRANATEISAKNASKITLSTKPLHK